ncbi:lipopolysaccharide biosynthesis protein [Acetobacterium wieringae]|uniref:lipopolysaccharide biosynthesis protein n=1 Tax=Acetobacterium wieringae TaxID=52694 RepID=UPI0026ED57F5|nr:lipopolysaccharide biosynthesis protein [Acetobacterium wieringae]
MDDKQIKSKVITSLFWKFMERLGTQGIQFVVQIVLARLILPEEYGTIALIMIFISFANVFVQYGFNTALIQKKDANETDFSSVFFLSLVVAGVCYAILFISAPLIADFFENPMLIPLLRVLSTTLFLGGLNSIQNAVVARNLEFKKLFYSSLGAVVGSGTIGIVMAYNGYGAWALVVQQLTNQLMVAGILWFTVKWRPGFQFSLESLKGLFSFGWKLLISALINMLYNNVQSLFIAKIYNPEMLGYFNRGQQFPSLIVSNINGSIQSVLFPALALKQDNRQRVKEMVRRAIVTSAFFIFPMMVGLAVIAEPLVTILLTDKWLPCVPFLQISCAAFALLPIHTANLQAINALGRSDIFLKLEIVKNIVSLMILGISIPYGIYAIAAGMFFSSVACSFINAYPNKKLLSYSYVQQLKDVMPSLLLSLAMGVIIYFFSWLNMNPLITLTLQVGAGILIYFGMAKLLKFESLTYLMVTVKEMLGNRKKRA